MGKPPEGLPEKCHPHFHAGFLRGGANFSTRPEALLPTVIRLQCDEHECDESHLMWFAGGLVALSITWRENLFLYGHVWTTLYAFWLSFVAPRMTDHALPRNGLRSIRLAIPSGVNVNTIAGGLFNEIATVFSGSFAGLTIERADWVPVCWRGCCWSRGQPAELPAALVSGFPTQRQFDVMIAPIPKHNTGFQAHARLALGIRPPPRRTILWVPPGGKAFGYYHEGGAHVHDESGLVAAVARWLAAKRPGWEVVRLDTDSYLERLRAFGQATVVVALFGSAVHNCRFMAPGATIVEIHGALRGNFDEPRDHFYDKICSGDPGRMNSGLGLHWVGFAPPGFRPVPVTTLTNRDRSHWRTRPFESKIIDGSSSFSTAHVRPGSFIRLLEQVLDGDRAPLVQAYRNRTETHRDPRHRDPLPAYPTG